MDDAPGAAASAAWTERLLLWGPGTVVGVGAGVVTAHGLFVVAAAAGVPAGIAWLYPIITDGLALVAYGATHRLQGRGTVYAWAVVVLAAGLSGLAQAIYLTDADVEVDRATRFGVGAWPAVAAAVSAHLIYLLGRSALPRGVRPSVGGAASGSPLPLPTPTRNTARSDGSALKGRLRAETADLGEHGQTAQSAATPDHHTVGGTADAHNCGASPRAADESAVPVRPP